MADGPHTHDESDASSRTSGLAGSVEFLHHKGIKVELKIARAAMVVCIHNQ